MAEAVAEIKKAVVVLGFHRGGTSATAGALAHCGLSAPRTLIDAVPGENDKGFWESSILSKFNDDLLEQQHTPWNTLWLCPEEPDQSQTLTSDNVDQLCELLSNEFPDVPDKILIKDPRICLLVPLWEKALRQFGYTPHYVLVLRSPQECAQSLAKRNGISNQLALLLWLQYIKSADLHTRVLHRVIVDYPELLSDAVRCVGVIDKTLDLKLSMSAEVKDSLRTFIDPDLNHFSTTDGYFSAAEDQLPMEVFELLTAKKRAALSPELDRIYKLSVEMLTLLLPLLDASAKQEHQYLQKLDDQEKEKKRLRSEVESALVRVQEVHKQVQAVAGRVAEEFARNQQLSVALEQARISLTDLQNVNLTHRELIESLDRNRIANEKQISAMMQSRSGRILRSFLNAAHACQRNPMGRWFWLRLKFPRAGGRLATEYSVISRSGLFDSKFYLRSSPDLGWMLTEPLMHYITVGHRLGFNPSANFSELEYKARFRDKISTSALYHSLNN